MYFSKVFTYRNSQQGRTPFQRCFFADVRKKLSVPVKSCLEKLMVSAKNRLKKCRVFHYIKTMTASAMQIRALSLCVFGIKIRLFSARPSWRCGGYTSASILSPIFLPALCRRDTPRVCADTASDYDTYSDWLLAVQP